MNDLKSKRAAAGIISAFFVVFTILCFFPKSLVANAAERSVSAPSENYSSVLYNNANGLPTSEANAIVQSADGYIFIGSYSGLTFYDGVSFTRFGAETGITSVVSLFIDKDDRLWIGTNDSGLALYDKGELTFYGRNAGLTSLSVRSIKQDGAGRIVFGTTEGVSYIGDDGAVYTINDPVVEGKYLKHLSSSDDGVIYGVTLDGVCFCLEDLAVTHSFNSRDLGIGVATCIIPDPDNSGTVWVGADASTVVRGNFREEMSDLVKFSVSPNTNINSLNPDGEGGFWVCTDNGIGELEANGSYTQHTDFPMNNSVEGMMTDYEGNRWFVSSRQGVMKIVESDFTNVSLNIGLESRVVNTTCVYGGELYIGTDTGLVLVGADGNRKTNSLTEALEGVRIRCIKSNSAGDRLWLCTYSEKGLICYNAANGSCEYFNTGNGMMKSDRVRSMTELSDGTIVAATSSGVALIKDGKAIRTFDEESGIGNTEILTVCEGDDGHIYMGSDGGGIFITDRENVIGRLGFDDGLKSEIILRIKQDPKGGYWVITGNSVAYMENETVRTITGFPYSNNFDIFFDEHDRIWILSSNGIYTINRETMLGEGNIEYSLYDINCGLPSVATANSYSCVSEDGTLYIAGTYVSSININEKKNDADGIKLSIPYIEIDDRRVVIDEDKTITVPADCKRLTIHAYAPTFLLTSPRLSYYLDGFDDSKITFSKQEIRPISYTNLKSGKYTFNFSVVDAMTGAELDNINIAIVKQKGLFEQFWFWAGVAAFALAGVMLFLFIHGKAKTRRLMQKREEDRVFVNQIIKAFAKCIDLKDKYTNGHSFRVARYTALIAERLGYDEQQIDDIYNIGLLHDIGKIAVPDQILGKPEALTKEEFEIISHHAQNGYEILREIEIRPDLAIGAGYHHEHVDGTGYPFGKKEDEIPEVAQIIAVADTFDAMNSTRPYRKQLYAEYIIDEMLKISGTQLNPHIVGVFLDIIREGKLDGVLIWENKSGKKQAIKSIEETAELSGDGDKEQ